MDARRLTFDELLKNSLKLNNPKLESEFELCDHSFRQLIHQINYKKLSLEETQKIIKVYEEECGKRDCNSMALVLRALIDVVKKSTTIQKPIIDFFVYQISITEAEFALQLLNRARNYDNVYAYMIAGAILAEDTTRIETATAHLQMAIDRGNPEAMCIRARLYENKNDYPAALKLYQRAAKNNNHVIGLYRYAMINCLHLIDRSKTPDDFDANFGERLRKAIRYADNYEKNTVLENINHALIQLKFNSIFMSYNLNDYYHIYMALNTGERLPVQLVDMLPTHTTMMAREILLDPFFTSKERDMYFNDFVQACTQKNICIFEEALKDNADIGTEKKVEIQELISTYYLQHINLIKIEGPVKLHNVIAVLIKNKNITDNERAPIIVNLVNSALTNRTAEIKYLFEYIDLINANIPSNLHPEDKHLTNYLHIKNDTCTYLTNALAYAKDICTKLHDMHNDIQNPQQGAEWYIRGASLTGWVSGKPTGVQAIEQLLDQINFDDMNNLNLKKIFALGIEIREILAEKPIEETSTGIFSLFNSRHQNTIAFYKKYYHALPTFDWSHASASLNMEIVSAQPRM